MKLLKDLNFWQLLATLLIAYVVYDYGQQTTTMAAISDLREKSDQAWAKVKLLPQKYDELSYEQRDLVASYINEYEHFCTLYNEGVVNERLVEITRRDTIFYVQNYYDDFIETWRDKQKKPDAWKQLELCAKNIMN